MKKVYSSAYDVIHLFAQRTQTEARCSNVFFYGDKIYSYGHHYLLGEFITNQSCELAIMINNKGYSQTTAKHISIIIGASSQYNQFFTKYCEPVRVLHQLQNFAERLQKAKKPELYILPARNLYSKFNEWLNWSEKRNDIVTISQIEEIIKVFNGSDYNEYLRQCEQIIKY